jgi:uncharacterized Zn finger protein
LLHRVLCIEGALMTPSIGEKDIRALAAPEVFKRGVNYWKNGEVLDLALRGGKLTASVMGSEDEPYAVSIRLSDGDIETVDCSCPYEGSGACKHIVATLLAYIANPGAVPSKPSIEDLLKALDRDALLHLVAKRASFDRDFTAWVETELAASPVMKSRPLNKADAKQIAKQAHSLLRKRYGSGGYWDNYRPHGDLGELQDLTEKAIPFLEAGDGRNALLVLEAVTDAFVSDWIAYSGGQDEHLYELFNDLGAMIAEAVLMSDLDGEEREAMAETVRGWADDLSDYGDFYGFDFAARVLEAPAEMPGLEAVLKGERSTWPPDASELWQDGEMVPLLLRMLRGQGRSEEFLNLARAAKARASYGTMLVALGRTEEASAFALAEVDDAEDALEIAKALMAANDRQAALRVGEHGLQFAPTASEAWRGVGLAPWLRDAAGAAGRFDLAALAAEMAFAHSRSLEDFRAAKRATGSEWLALRDRLLRILAAGERSYYAMAIYLEEGMIAEAVDAAGQLGQLSPHDDVLLRLAQAARRSHPDWVIATARRLADELMNRGNTGTYELAARWLHEAARAYEDEGREEEWQKIITGLIETHRRRYKLKPLLEALRAGTFG